MKNLNKNILINSLKTIVRRLSKNKKDMGGILQEMIYKKVRKGAQIYSFGEGEDKKVY